MRASREKQKQEKNQKKKQVLLKVLLQNQMLTQLRLRDERLVQQKHLRLVLVLLLHLLPLLFLSKSARQRHAFENCSKPSPNAMPTLPSSRRNSKALRGKLLAKLRAKMTRTKPMTQTKQRAKQRAKQMTRQIQVQSGLWSAATKNDVTQ